jgi:acetyltransferase
VILFGAGGTAVEVLQDKALALPPLNRMLARRLMAETRVYRLLEGYRGRAPAALDEIADSLVRLSQMIADLPQVAEVDINPLLADEDRVIALDARVRVQQSMLRPGAHLAIRPYPKELEHSVTTSQGLSAFIRPIRPEDEPLLRTTFQKLSPEDIRMRFFAPLRELNHPMAARLTQIDYDREMALVALSGEGPDAEGLGVVRVSLDPDGQRAEYAVIVRSDLKGKGLGYTLMEDIIAYCRSRKVQEIYGDVLAENQAMLGLLQDLGFNVEHDAQDPGVLRVVKSLE